AYNLAIERVMDVIAHLGQPFSLSHDDPAVMWFLDLGRQLEDLDSGIVSPTFRCAAGSNALPTTEWMKRVRAVVTTEHHHAAGVKWKEAARRAIVDHGLEAGSESDVLSWCKEFRRGNVKNREAAREYEDLMSGIREAEREYEDLMSG